MRIGRLLRPAATGCPPVYKSSKSSSASRTGAVCGAVRAIPGQVNGSPMSPNWSRDERSAPGVGCGRGIDAAIDAVVHARGDSDRGAATPPRAGKGRP